MSDISLFVNVKPFPNEGLSVAMDHEKTYVMGYGTLLEVSSIHHTNSGRQMMQDMYINGYFTLLLISQTTGVRWRVTRPTARMVISGSS